jgi:pimeloyl-ACP methyl ester carboxylesterase
MVDVARFFMDFCRDESCGKCVPCRVGTSQMLRILEKICNGSAVMDDLDKLQEMGKMVQDARHAIDAVLHSPDVDPSRIYLYGFAMGGMTGILTAALDERVAGLVTVAGFTPMRTDTADKRTSGVRRLSHFYGWIPRLGAFVGNEDRIPVDFDEVLAAVAPRPVLVIAPTLDRYATLADIEAAVQNARNAYEVVGAKDGIELQMPEDENRLTDPMQANAISWLKSHSTR